MKKASIFLIITATLLLAACAAPTAQPTPLPTLISTTTVTITVSPTPPPTFTPTNTPEPTATPTAMPTATTPPTPTATPTPRLPLPVGKPDAKWEGVPIMPDAIAGKDGGGSYMFTVKASAKDIQTYYDREMIKIGYNSMGAGKATGNNLSLFYQRQGKQFRISIIDLGTQDGILLVMLVK